MSKWDELTMAEKAEMMKVAVRNGITKLQDIRDKYNEFAEGGSIDTDWNYNSWKRQVAEHMDIRPDEDNTYDYEAYFNKYPEEAWKMLKGDPSAHFSDEFKTVYHPTFSSKSVGNDGSIYSGIRNPKTNPQGLVGGTWSPDYHTFTMSPDGYRGPVSMDDRKWYLENAEDNGVVLREADGSLPIYDGIPWGGVLPNVTVYGNKHAEGGNLFGRGGYKPSASVKRRISTWEGAAMTGAIDPLSGKWGKNRSFEAEADSFYNALPTSIRNQVLSNPELADNLFSYSYNVGAGNFRKRVVPALEKYYTGNGSPEEIANSMWATGDKKLRGLRNRRAVERKGVVDALTPAFAPEPADNTFVFNPFAIQAGNTYQRPIIVPDEDSYVTAHEVSPSEQKAQKVRESFDAINRFNALMNMLNMDTTAPTYTSDTGNPFLDAIGVLTNSNANGGKIYIKPENRGKFTALKKRTGHSATWFKEHGTPAQKKMATFALNARKWKHGLGGNLFDGTTEDSQQMDIAVPDATYVASTPLFHPISRKEYDWEDAALHRTNQVYSNYDEAKDEPLSLGNILFRNSLRWIKDNIYEDFPSGVSNCTLSATQWVDPQTPVKGAKSIHTDPERFNYTAIDSADVVPGNLIISKVPNKDSYHTMMVTGFAGQDSTANFRGKNYPVKKGEPLMTYSKGGHDNSFIQRNIPLSIYTANSDGHTQNLFYRYNYPREVFLPEIVVTPNKKKK